MRQAEKNAYKWVRKKVSTPIDRLLVRATMWAFGWKFLKKSEVPYYGVSDEGEKKTYLKKYYYFARPQGYSKNPLFHVAYGAAGLSRFLRRLAFYFSVIFWVLAFLGTALTSAWPEFVEIIPIVEMLCVGAFAASFAYIAMTCLNLLIAGAALLLRPKNASILSQRGEEGARRAVDRNEQLDLDYAAQQDIYATQKANRLRQAYEERLAWEEEKEYKRLINEYNTRVDQINEAERMANKALTDPYLTDDERLRMMDDATYLSRKAMDEANYFSQEIEKMEEE